MKNTLLACILVFAGVALSAATWTGAVSDNWHTAGNWFPASIPVYDTDVVISTTGTGNYPRISTTAAYCRNMQIDGGTYVHIYTNSLNVTGNLSVAGYIQLSTDPCALYVEHDITWQSGSQALLSNWARVYCDGNMTYAAGSQVSNSGGTIEFRGSTPTTLINHSFYTHLPNVVVNKPWSATMVNSLTVPATNSQDIRVTSLTNTNGSSFIFNWWGNFYIWGDLIDLNTQTGAGIRFNAGYQFPNGSNQSFNFASTQSYLNEVWTYQSGTLSLDSDLVIKTHLRIQSGTVDANNHTLYVGGDWLNLQTPASFLEETGTVVFNGSGNQSCYISEQFNNLTLQKSGGLFIVANVNSLVSCNSFNWVSGDISVHSGNFTALDLAQNSIRGKWYLYPGGSVDLFQDSAQQIDLRAELYILGGDFRIHGGAIACDVADGGNARIEMTSGSLDFVDEGVQFGDLLYTTTFLVSGGSLRSGGRFWDALGGLIFTGGELELHGPESVSLKLTGTSRLNDLVINKAGAATVFPNSLVTMNGELRLQTGNLDLNGWNMTVMGNAHLRGTLIMNAAATLDVHGAVFWYSGANAQTTAGTINCGYDWSFEAGCSVNLAGSVQRMVNPYGSSIYALSATASFGQLELLATEDDAEFPCYFYDSQLRVANDLVIHSPSTLNLLEGVATVQGSSYIHSGGKLIVGDGGSFTTNGVLMLEGALITGPGTAIVHGMFYTGLNSLLDVEWGIFRCDAPDNGDNVLLRGGIDLFHGGLELTHLSAILTAHPIRVFDQSQLRVGGDLTATGSNSYQPVGGSLRLIGARDSALEFNAVNFASDLYVEKASTEYGVYLNTNLNVHGYTHVNSGRLDLNHHSLFSQVEVNVVSELEVDNGAELILGASGALIVQALGRLEVLGVAGDPAEVSGFSSSQYSFTVHSGGELAASHAQFSFMDINGVRLLAGSLLDPQHCFDHCRFSNGQAGGTLLSVENSQELTVLWAEFPANTWGGTSNVRKTLDQGRLTFFNYIGAFSGEAFDYDTFNRVDWGNPVPAPIDLTITYTPADQLMVLDWVFDFPFDHFNIYWADAPEGPFTLRGTSVTRQWSDSSAYGRKFFRVAVEY